MKKNYFPIPLKGIVINSVPDFDLYIPHKKRYVLYRKANYLLSNEIVRNLVASNIVNLYVKGEDLKRYERYRERMLEGQPGKKGMLHLEGIYVDPMEIERYYNVMENFHSVDREVFAQGVQFDFPLFYREVNNVFPLPEYEGRPEGQWIQSETAVHAGRELMIRNEDLGKYQRLVENMMASVDSEAENEGRVKRKALFLREMSKVTVQNLLKDPRSGENLEKLRENTNTTIEFILENEVAFYSLMRINAHDFYTYVHSINTSVFCIGLGLALRLTRSPDLELLALGGALHDVGKCLVDQKIINKPGKLTLPEFRKMKNHVRFGIDLLKEHQKLPDGVYQLISQHHERLSGNGYPLGLRSEQITLFGRVAAIVDTYDILTTDRSYKKALKPFDALHVITKAEGDFDQKLLRVFISLLGKQVKE